ncbi:MAG: hypothetical protein HOP15_10150 [Planctomycetes bacterium]|nr:hypothetical protein [Planctomycetota bacterium]
MWARPPGLLEEGRMEFGRLPRGRGTLFITAPGMDNYSEPVTLTGLVNSHPVRLLGGGGSSERAAVTVRFIDAAGAPLPGLDVRLHPPAGSPQRGTTNQAGEVRFLSFPVTQSAVIRAYDPEFDWPYPAYQGSLDPFSGAELRMSYSRPGARVAGRLLRRDGDVGIAQLVLVRAEERHRVLLTCADDGAFDAGTFPEGEYDLRVELADVGTIDVGRRTLVRGETVDCGDLDLRRGGNLRVLAKAEHERLSVFVTDATRTLEATVQGGEAWFRGIPEGNYVLTSRGSDVAMLGLDVRIEPSLTQDVRLTLERGVPVTLHAVASESRKLREIWSDARGRTLWIGPSKLWTPEELARLRIYLVPGVYTLDWEDVEGHRATNNFAVEFGASSLAVPMVLP